MKLKGPGRLPLPKNLLEQRPDQLLNTLNRFGLQVDVLALQVKADTAFNKRLGKVLQQGVVPDETTLTAIIDQHTRDLQHSLRTMTKGAIRGYRAAKMGNDGKFVWITVEDEKVCPSCEKRHGKEKTMKQWSVLGKPGTAALICGEECRCELVPSA